MAQHIGTAGRSGSNSPAAFLAGTLLAVATMATVIVLALALGVSVEIREGAAAAQPRALTPSTTYDGHLDPIEDAYINGAHAGAVSAPRLGVSIYDGRLDPIEQTYIRGAHSGQGSAPGSVPHQPAAADHSWTQNGLPRYQLVPR